MCNSSVGSVALCGDHAPLRKYPGTHSWYPDTPSYCLMACRATYRYLIFGPDRQELKENIGKFYEKISGKKDL